MLSDERIKKEMVRFEGKFKKDYLMWRDEDGDYKEFEVRLMWIGWLAAIEAQETEINKFRDLAKSFSQPLDPEFAKILEENSWDLYIKSEPRQAQEITLPNDAEIGQVAVDEAQQDWDDLKFKDVYIVAFMKGASWMKSKVIQ